MAHRQDGKDSDPRDAQSKIPPTPGYHAVPGKQVPARKSGSVPATPGYHAVPKAQHNDARKGQMGTPTRTQRPSGAGVATPPRGPVVPARKSPSGGNAPRSGETPRSGGRAVPRVAPHTNVTGRAPQAGQRPPRGNAAAAPQRNAPTRPAPGAKPAASGRMTPHGAARQDTGTTAAPAATRPATATAPATQPAPTTGQVPPYTPPRGATAQTGTKPAGAAPVRPAASPTPELDEAAQRRADRAQARAHRDAERAQARAEADSRPSVGVLFAKLSEQVQTLIRGEIELAKMKAKTLASKAGTGVALLAVAGVLALYMLGVLLHAAVLGLSHAVPDWAAALIVAAVLLVLVIIFALIGKSLLSRGLAHPPAPQKGLKKDVDAVKKGIGK